MTDHLSRSVSSSNSFAHSITENIAGDISGGITEADVQITSALSSRPTRQFSRAVEVQAMQILAQQLMDDPLSMLKTLVGIVLDRTQAGTAGVSLLETAPNGESVFRWVAIAGAFADLEQTTIPGDFSPDGTTLHSNQPQLYAYPERYFTDLPHPQLSIVEELLIPLCASRQPLGTLWLLSHDESRRFDAEDQQFMTSFAGFTTAALQSLQQMHQTHKNRLQQEQEVRIERSSEIQTTSTPIALHQSQELSQQILTSSNDCIKVLDLEGRILFMSQGGQALLGIRDITPFLNQSWIKFWQESEQQAVSEAIAKARAGEVCTLQGYCPTLSGEPKWWDNKISPIRGTDGQVERLLCVSRDITERRQIEEKRQQAEENLRDSEARYRAIVNQAMTGVASSEIGGKLTLVNQKYCDITGYSATELCEMRMHDITHPEDLPRNVELYNRMLAEGTSFEIEKRYIRKDGSIVWVNNHVSVVCDAQGKPRSAVAIVLDITKRKRAEAALRESEENFRAMFNVSSVGKAQADAKNRRFLRVNPALCEMTGYSESELLTMTVDELNHPEDREQDNELYQCLEREQTGNYQSEKRYLRKDGSTLWVNVTGNIIRDPQGNALRTVAVIQDITDRKRIEDERKRREANAAFLAEITNDFSRLLTANEIMQVVGAKIGAYLQITTCNFTDVCEERGEVTVHHGWNSIDVPSTVGTFQIKEYLSKEFEQASRAGETVVIRNTQTDPRTDAPGYAALNMYSFVTVPFHRNGQWTHYIAICDSRPRNWREDEIELIEEISNRIFPRLERARAEAALRASEAKYRSLFESMDEGFCILQLIFDEAQKPIDYRYIEINPVFEQQTGMKNALGKTVRELVPEVEPFWFDIYGQVALTGEPIRFVDHAESMGRWFDVNAFRVGKPHEHKVAVLFNDITSRKQAEVEREQLLANERHYANQLQGLTNAALAINSALSVEEVLKVITNQAASIIGTHQSITSMTIDQNWTQAVNTIYLSDKYTQWQNYDELTDESGIYACVCHLNRPMRMTQAELEAHPRWKEFGEAAAKHPPLRGWLAAPLVDRNGCNIGLIQLSDKYEGEFTEADEAILVQLAQMASVAVENARLYEAEQQARSAAEASREEAQAANRVKDEFLAVLSHELRSPLNPILGWSTLLLNNKLNEAKTAQALATIQRNARLQSDLIEDLLDVSRILRGKLSLNVTAVNLAAIIRAAMETVRLAAEAKSIQVESRLDPDVGLVSGDPTRLQQVIWNLLSNAVKFTPEGGQVSIQLEHQNTHAQIIVSDTGQGIALDFLPYVFDYFRQANAATTRRFSGLGLGLAIVRHLVELHGGTVEVESPGMGMGATFIVRLPLMSTKVIVSQENQPPESDFNLNGIKVLVVDDELDSREFVVFVLEQAGAEITTATTAHEAITMLSRSKPDILLSDIGMPDMDGYMLIQQVRALPSEEGQVPAIALTAYAGEMNQQQALAAGFQQHISKPIEPEKLIQAISILTESAARSLETQ